MVSDKQLYPTFARTIFGDNSIGPSVSAIMNYFNWNLVGIISEEEHDWKRRADFLESFLDSVGKTVTMHSRVPYYRLYKEKEHGEQFKEVLSQSKNKARSKCKIFQFAYASSNLLKQVWVRTQRARRVHAKTAQTFLKRSNHSIQYHEMGGCEEYN